MTFAQTGKMLAQLSAVYPARLMPDINENTIKIWADLLKDVDDKQALDATREWIQTNKYPPTIADIREQIANAHRLPVRQNPKPV
jgi:hypothetical protein